jgi:hypothetical protein
MTQSIGQENCRLANIPLWNNRRAAAPFRSFEVDCRSPVELGLRHTQQVIPALLRISRSDLPQISNLYRSPWRALRNSTYRRDRLLSSH